MLSWADQAAGPVDHDRAVEARKPHAPRWPGGLARRVLPRGFGWRPCAPAVHCRRSDVLSPAGVAYGRSREPPKMSTFSQKEPGRVACHEPQHGWSRARLRRLHARRRPSSSPAWRSWTPPWPWSFPRSADGRGRGSRNHFCHYAGANGGCGTEHDGHRTLSRCDSESARRVVKSLTLASSVAF